MRDYRLGFLRKAVNVGAKGLIKVGVVPPGVRELRTVGRKSGIERSTPVQLVRVDGKRWLVAPYGVVGWVHNARAAGRVRLKRAGKSEEFSIREASADEAGPVLKKYVRVSPVVLPFFEAGLRSAPEAFAAEADRHPVFELVPLGTEEASGRP